MKRFPFLLAILLTAAGSALAAITAPGPAHVPFAELEQYRATGIPDDRWPALMETLGSDEQRVAVRGLIKELKAFPAAKLVGLLSHSRLAVRLGALEVLEDAAGETFDFDPWQENSTQGSNAESLQRWNAWVEKGGTPASIESVKLTDETFRVIAQEITGGKPERAERAMRRLGTFGMAAIAPIEAFLQSQPGLEDLPKAMLKQAEYRVLIGQSLPRRAAALARDLTVGAPEAQSTALSALGAGGTPVLPILSDFLASPDPLVRESAVDAAFVAGGKHSVAMIVARVPKEDAESVLHAMLRGLGRFGTTSDAAKAIVGFLEHPSENVVVAAVEALGFNKAGNPVDALKKCLTDSRWRVRAAALETIGKRNLAACKDAVIQSLQDTEIFVRVTAVSTLKRIAPEDTAPLLEQFEKQHELKAPILSAFFSDSRKSPPDRLWELLRNAPPETILQCLETMEDRSDHEGKRAVFAAPFARHANPDVSAAALRILAGHGRSTGLLLEALQGDDMVKKDAVLDPLSLPSGFLSVKANDSPAPVSPVAANPKLDSLYDRLRGAVPAAAAPDVAAAPVLNNEANPSAMSAALLKILREGSPRQRMRAALVLAPSGEPEAFAHLAGNVDTLTPVDRRGIAAALGGVQDWKPIWDLALRLLQDPADDVRETAIESWVNDANPERIAGLLKELSRKDSKLNPGEIYDYQFDRVLEGGAVGGEVVQWSRQILTDPNVRDSAKAFAIVVLQRAGRVGDVKLETFIQSTNPILRRAVFRALGLKFAEAHIDQILKDDSALVRTVLPFLAAPANKTWEHYFDDATYVADSEDYHSSGSKRTFGAWAGNADRGGTASEPVIAAIEKLARDPAERVRFEAMFAMLRMGRSVDPSAFASAVTSQAPEVHAREQLGNFLEQDYARLGKGYAVLLPLAEGISEDRYSKMVVHFGIQEGNVATSFASLAKLKPLEIRPSDNQIAAAVPVQDLAAGGPFRVLFFHKVGCRDCERVRDMLARHAAAFPKARIEEHDIEDSRVAVLNEALSSRFQVRDTLHQVTPAIFTQAGVLVRDDITFPALGDLLRSTESTPRDANWAAVEMAEVATAQDKIVQRYDALSLGVVGLAGLLDGINPCAFATIIFLLSYLHVARRSPREILAVGVAFIGAVFLSYFLVGLGLVQVLARLDAMRVAGTVLNYVLAGFALILALFSFRDAQLASRGQFGEMTLQLPGMLKEQIRTAIRSSAKASRFVLAAFAAGIVISMLELACTGQVYLPTILYMLRSGRSGAMGHLLVYNLAFVLPLVVVFGLAWTGMRSDALVRFQQRNVALVKVLTGLLFLFLTLFLLFGHLVMPELGGKK